MEVGHQPLDVALPDRGDGAQHHRRTPRRRRRSGPLAAERRRTAPSAPASTGPSPPASAPREERGHRRRRAFVDIGRPHVEGHRRDLEGESRARWQADDQPHRARVLARQSIRQPAKLVRAGEAVDQRSAVEQHARGQRAEDEVLQPGLGRASVVAVEGGDDVERQRAAPGRGRARSDRSPRSSSACRVWQTGRAPGTRTGRSRSPSLKSRAIISASAGEQDQHLEEEGEGVRDEHAAESGAPRRARSTSTAATSAIRASRSTSPGDGRVAPRAETRRG